MNEDFYDENNLQMQVLVINKFCCCFENYPNGLYSPILFKRYLNFVKKFLIFKKEYQEQEKMEFFKILKKKIFVLFYEMLNVFILEKQMYSMLILFKFLFEETQEIRIVYKLIKVFYIFEKRGKNIHFKFRLSDFFYQLDSGIQIFG